MFVSRSFGRATLVGIFVFSFASCGSKNDGASKASEADIATNQVPVGASSNHRPNPTPTPSTAPTTTPTPGITPTPTPTGASPAPAPTPTPTLPPVPAPTASPAPTPTPIAPPPTNPNKPAPAGGSIAWPSLDFIDNPGGHDPKGIALTFDDGPDGYSGSGGTNNTGYILDQLKTLGVHATFFICDHVWTDVASDPLAQQDIQRMISEGHDVGNHTLDHTNLSTLNAAQIDAEFAQNAASLAIPQALGPNFKMSMYRAPFGVPYEDNTVDVARTAPVTAKYGVHVGWGIETNDWDCAQANLTSKCIIDNLNAQLDAGRTGIILMHSVYRITGDALPAIVQTIAAHGLHIVSVENMIQEKYGMTSAQILAANVNASFPTQDVSTAAQNACSGNNFEIYAPYPNGTTGAE